GGPRRPPRPLSFGEARPPPTCTSGRAGLGRPCVAACTGLRPCQAASNCMIETPMNEPVNVTRRRIIGGVAAAIGLMGLAWGGNVASALAADGGATPSPAPAAPLGPIHQIDAGALNIGYADLGPREAPVVLLLHGWPYDIHAFAEVAPQLVAAGYR